LAFAFAFAMPTSPTGNTPDRGIRGAARRDAARRGATRLTRLLEL